MSIDEPELIARILGGNRNEYRILVERYKDGLYRHCFYITHDEGTAEDMSQEAFIRAYLYIEKYNADKATFKT